MHRRAACRRRTHGADSGHSWVPKFSLDRVPQRSDLPVLQTAEQFVEVPTNPGYTLAVVASKLCSRREIRRILSGLGSTASGFGQVVDNPVPQGRGGGGARGGLQGSRAGQNSPAYLEQIVDIPARGGLQGFLPGQGSSSRRFLHDEDEGFQWVFRTFPRPKKCEGYPPVEWWRHEQQSIAAALATSHHHSAQRGQKKARAGEGDFELNFAAKIRRHPPPPAAGTVYYPMDVDDVPATSGSRPDRLSAVSGPQERVPRHIVEQIVDTVPVVQLLHVPVPQPVDSVLEVLNEDPRQVVA